MKRKPSKRSSIKRQIKALEAARCKLETEVHELLDNKHQATEDLRELRVSKQFTQSQISFSKRLLFQIDTDLRVHLSEQVKLIQKRFVRLLDEEVFRLIHGGRKPSLILVSPSGVMLEKSQKQIEAGGRFNYAGIPIAFCMSIRTNCFIIQSTVGKTCVAGERGWAEVATAGYNTA